VAGPPSGTGMSRASTKTTHRQGGHHDEGPSVRGDGRDDPAAGSVRVAMDDIAATMQQGLLAMVVSAGLGVMRG